MKQLIFIIALLVNLSSCSSFSNNDTKCVKVNLKETDFTKVAFTALPLPVRNTIIQLATQIKKTDTAFSLDKGITYSYYNPGDGKAYIKQVLSSRHIHTINGKCYEFLLYSEPYILYDNKIYSLEQNLTLDCSTEPCQPDTLGLSETYLYALPLVKLKKNNSL